VKSGTAHDTVHFVADLALTFLRWSLGTFFTGFGLLLVCSEWRGHSAPPLAKSTDYFGDAGGIFWVFFLWYGLPTLSIIAGALAAGARCGWAVVTAPPIPGDETEAHETEKSA